MVKRIGFIYLLFIVLISVGTFVSCDPTCRQLDGTEVPCMFESSTCDTDEQRCNGECISNKVDCCKKDFTLPEIEPFPCPIDKPKCCDGECIPSEVGCCLDTLFNFVGPCTESEPLCCPDGSCISDRNLCPDVTECPENLPQFCGPQCTFEDWICCEDREGIESLTCPPSKPICCPLETFPKCAETFEDCCQGTGCI